MHSHISFCHTSISLPCHMTWQIKSLNLTLIELSFPFPHIRSHPRSHLPVWRSERGGGHHQPERHEPVPAAPALGPHLLLRPRPAGLGPEGLGGQGGERQGLPGGVHQESSGKEEERDKEEDRNGRSAFIWLCWIHKDHPPQVESADGHVGTMLGNFFSGQKTVEEVKCSPFII